MLTKLTIGGMLILGTLAYVTEGRVDLTAYDVPAAPPDAKPIVRRAIAPLPGTGVCVFNFETVTPGVIYECAPRG